MTDRLRFSHPFLFLSLGLTVNRPAGRNGVTQTNNRRFALVLVALFSVAFCMAQQADSLKKANNGQWIRPMAEYMALKISQSSDVEKLSVKPQGPEIKLAPNTKSLTRFSLSYKFISLSYSFALKFLPGNDDDEIRGKTKNMGFGLGLNFNHWMQDLSWKKTQGFYLENTGDHIPTWSEGDPYFQFTDLVYNNFQGITAYKFNSRFSVNAVATQSERQLRSAGSFIPALLYRYYIINDKSEITANRTMEKSNIFELILGAGYYHSFVFSQRFYISAGATPGFGYVFSKTRIRSQTDETAFHQSDPIFRVDARLGAGYNGERFFTGLYGTMFSAVYKQERAPVQNQDTRVTYQFFIGYRLDAPGFLRKSVENVQNRFLKQ